MTATQRFGAPYVRLFELRGDARATGSPDISEMSRGIREGPMLFELRIVTACRSDLAVPVLAEPAAAEQLCRRR
jgi:hypothetical protein